MAGRRSTASVVAGLCLAFAASASAKTYDVTRVGDPIPGACKSGDCSLREAISAANVRPGPDRVRLKGGKTYRLDLAGSGEDANAFGDFDITDELTLLSTGHGRATIDGQQRDRVLHARDVRLTLSGLVIRNGLVRGAGNSGGGVLSERAPLKIDASKFTENVALEGSGGAIATSTTMGGAAAPLTITHAVVAGNAAAGTGGGIQAAGGGITLTRSTVKGNLGGSYGGGMIVYGRTVLTNSKILGNESSSDGGGLASTTISRFTARGLLIRGNETSGKGGGIAMFASFAPPDIPAAVISDSTIERNKAVDHGGGLLNERPTVVKRSTIAANRAQVGGGGVANDGECPCDPTLTLQNDTIQGNHADGFGGGIDNFGGATATLQNVTVAGNEADADDSGGGAGGGMQNASEQGSTAHVGNSLIVGNTVGTSGADPTCSGVFDDDLHNLLSALDCGGFSQAEALQGPAHLLALGDYGGPTQTMALAATSPAVDAGGGCPETDQRGVKRPQGKKCDVGAFERRKKGKP